MLATPTHSSAITPTPTLPARGRELSLRSLKPAIDTRRHCEPLQGVWQSRISKLILYCSGLLRWLRRLAMTIGNRCHCEAKPAISTQRHCVEKRNPVMLVTNILASEWAKQSTNKNSSNFEHLYNLIGIMDSDFRRNDGGEESWHTGLLRWLRRLAMTIEQPLPQQAQ